MKKEYDLSKMQARHNPYAKQLKKQVTLRLHPDVIAYFKEMAEEAGLPYQSLINLYLQDCVKHHRGDHYTILRGGKPAAELVPAGERQQPVRTLTELRGILQALPRLGRDDASFADDVLAAAKAQPPLPEPDAWE